MGMHYLPESTDGSHCIQGSSEVFFRRLKVWDKEHSDAPPVFNVDGVSYLHVKVTRLREVSSCKHKPDR